MYTLACLSLHGSQPLERKSYHYLSIVLLGIVGHEQVVEWWVKDLPRELLPGAVIRFPLAIALAPALGFDSSPWNFMSRSLVQICSSDQILFRETR